MPLIPPNIPQSLVGPSPALDALRQLGTASPASGMAPNPGRLTETKEPLPATPPNQRSTRDLIMESLMMAYGTPPNLNDLAMLQLPGPKLNA